MALTGYVWLTGKDDPTLRTRPIVCVKHEGRVTWFYEDRFTCWVGLEPYRLESTQLNIKLPLLRN